MDVQTWAELSHDPLVFWGLFCVCFLNIFGLKVLLNMFFLLFSLGSFHISLLLFVKLLAYF